MSEVRITIEGESYLTLEAISECYECDVRWLREAYEFGLFGRGRVDAGRVVLRITVLDRVAEVVRLARYQGLGFEAIDVLIGETVEADVVDVFVEVTGAR